MPNHELHEDGSIEVGPDYPLCECGIPATQYAIAGEFGTNAGWKGIQYFCDSCARFAPRVNAIPFGYGEPKHVLRVTNA